MREIFSGCVQGLQRYIRVVRTDVQDAFELLVAQGAAAQPRLNDRLRRIGRRRHRTTAPPPTSAPA